MNPPGYVAGGLRCPRALVKSAATEKERYYSLREETMKPDSALAIIRELKTHGYEAYLVGGCVRDKVMGFEASDYDIATSALPEEVTRIFRRTESIGAQFGVVLVIHHGHPFEV